MTNEELKTNKNPLAKLLLDRMEEDSILKEKFEENKNLTFEDMFNYLTDCARDIAIDGRTAMSDADALTLAVHFIIENGNVNTKDIKIENYAPLKTSVKVKEKVKAKENDDQEDDEENEDEELSKPISKPIKPQEKYQPKPKAKEKVKIAEGQLSLFEL